MDNGLELLIMKALWSQSGSATIGEIAQSTGKQATGITTALEEMADRGLVAYEGGSYRPLLTASEYCAVEVRGLVDQLYGGDAVAFLYDYIGTAGPEDRAALENAINKGDRQS